MCQSDENTGLCRAVHPASPLPDVGDKSGFRLSMIDEIHDDRLALLWDEDCTRERRRRAAKIGCAYLFIYLIFF